MIEFNVNGTQYKDFIGARVTTAMDSLANDFSFTSSAVDDFPPFKIGDPVEAMVDGVKVLTGYIDEIAGEDSDASSKITYSGRDRTSDLIDSYIDQMPDIRADSLTLADLIRQVIDHLGGDLQVIDDVNPDPFNVAEDYLTPKPGDSALAFIEKYARKRQVLLTSNADGDIVITQAKPTYSGDVLQSIRGDDSNNVIYQKWWIDHGIQFNKYVHRGQLDLRALNFSGDTDIATIEDQGAEVANTAIRQGRQRVVVERGYSAPQLASRALWASQMMKAKGFRYMAGVVDHSKPDGGLWRDGELVQVNSDPANISQIMLINSVTFTQADEEPIITVLECVERNVYATDDRTRAKRNAGGLGDAFGIVG